MEHKTHYPLIRTIYLYLFALTGLTLVIIGTVRFLDMGLKAFIFTQAEEQEQIWQRQPTMPYALDSVSKVEAISQTLTSEEKDLIKQWLVDYKAWQETNAKLDPITAQRHRDASINLALILVGLPLYLYHWGVIKKETKKV